MLIGSGRSDNRQIDSRFFCFFLFPFLGSGDECSSKSNGDEQELCRMWCLSALYRRMMVQRYANQTG